MGIGFCFAVFLSDFAGVTFCSASSSSELDSDEVSSSCFFFWLTVFPLAFVEVAFLATPSSSELDSEELSSLGFVILIVPLTGAVFCSLSSSELDSVELSSLDLACLFSGFSLIFPAGFAGSSSSELES